jgi:hypothetical protein
VELRATQTFSRKPPGAARQLLWEPQLQPFHKFVGIFCSNNYLTQGLCSDVYFVRKEKKLHLEDNTTNGSKDRKESQVPFLEFQSASNTHGVLMGFQPGFFF